MNMIYNNVRASACLAHLGSAEKRRKGALSARVNPSPSEFDEPNINSSLAPEAHNEKEELHKAQ